MKRILKNKKIILLLTVLLLLVIFSAYIKTSEVKLTEIYQKPEETEAEFFLKGEKASEKNEKIVRKEETVEDSREAKVAVSKIALISEIKDPFKADSDSSSGQKAAAEKEQRKNIYPAELIDLEKNVIASDLIKNTARDNKLQQENPKESELKPEQNSVNQVAAENKLNIAQLQLPFKLLGIIRQNNNSAVLFRYQGQAVVKSENDKIGQFTIKEIQNKEIIIGYQQAERVIKLWEDGKNEN
ncbi:MULTISPECIES: hypothetical protein [Halanaerobium]|uniref:Uncharacterized protein n=1 Tax=Halanaerobium saccharolyticum TaxID=43595 RepID=A0A4R6SBN7_9FIRM|nr:MULTISPECIES: hypothetical protein [Halanaerobium]PUU89785.1 MAG: hypothetical protein CI949_2603 [Halanaerobium sp.]PUU90690.1 MAG: hypothetical protein CI947_1391 [Halanaerobium sp.]TDP96984.1 hypothetical protein C7957_10679 [Halanaerobium saccharolyticum]